MFQYGHNPWLRNLSSLECLEKCHSKLIHSLVDDRFDKKAIPVRKFVEESPLVRSCILGFSLIQFLCKTTRDLTKETKILKTLELLELPCRTVCLLIARSRRHRALIGLAGNRDRSRAIHLRQIRSLLHASDGTT